METNKQKTNVLDIKSLTTVQSLLKNEYLNMENSVRTPIKEVIVCLDIAQDYIDGIYEAIQLTGKPGNKAMLEYAIHRDGNKISLLIGKVFSTLQDVDEELDKMFN